MMPKELLLLIIAIMLLLGIQIFTSIIVYRDAKGKGFSPELWTVLNFLMPFIGLLIYFVVNTGKSQDEISQRMEPPMPPIVETTQVQGSERDLSNRETRVVRKTKGEPKTIAELYVKKGPREGHRHGLKEGNTKIGFAPGNDIIIEDETVSKEHAIIQCKGAGEFLIINLSLKNKVRVNGEEISSQEIKDGDKIELGEVGLVFLCRIL
ncbi:MAG: FHA domain-containing protein [Nitrospirae bacterium]|nr:FHA domain-containing protein [Nitrospirota bacterium]